LRTIALTGGIGMGKTTAAERLGAAGHAVVDTDQVARDLVEPGQGALADIRGAFGVEVLDSQGQLRREELARRVFADPVARRRLEEILHPRIRAVWESRIEDWRREGRRLAVVVIPLLFEIEAERQFDRTVCLACSERSQRVRLQARGWSEQEIQGRLAAQLPTRTKMERADYVVWTEGDLRLLDEQLRRLLEAIG
jgi:dephospho-CoA kinase